MDATPVVQPANGAVPSVTSSQPEQLVIFSIRTLTGEVWRMGTVPPVPDISPCEITAIVAVPCPGQPDRFDVFSCPLAGSEMDKQKMATIYSVYQVGLVTTYASREVWNEKRKEAVEGLEVECPHCGMLPSEEDEEPPTPENPVPS